MKESGFKTINFYQPEPNDYEQFVYSSLYRFFREVGFLRLSIDSTAPQNVLFQVDARVDVPMTHLNPITVFERHRDPDVPTKTPAEIVSIRPPAMPPTRAAHSVASPRSFHSPSSRGHVDRYLCSSSTLSR